VPVVDSEAKSNWGSIRFCTPDERKEYFEMKKEIEEEKKVNK
jgi:hypothetical protein